MKSSEYLELINGYKKSLNRKEALFQAIYLIKKDSLDSAIKIIDSYELKIGEFLSANLDEKSYEKLLNYIKK